MLIGAAGSVGAFDSVGALDLAGAAGFAGTDGAAELMGLEDSTVLTVGLCRLASETSADEDR